MVVSKKGTYAIVWVASRISPPPFFVWNAIFTWKNDWQINYVSQIWISGRHFLQQKQSKPVTSKQQQQQQLTMIFANGKIWAFELKLEFWETFINQGQFDSFPIHKIFSDEIDGEFNEATVIMKIVDIWKICIIQWNNEQFMILQSHACIRYSKCESYQWNYFN